jgi:murein DD-endopeptidase MepM/ murein hydrolase activator NlpD
MNHIFRQSEPVLRCAGLLLLLIVATSSTAFAEATLKCPESVPEGTPFIVRVASDEPMAAIVARWMGKEAQLTPEKRGRGSVAFAMLGVGLREARKGDSFPLEIEVKTPSGAKTLKATVRRAPRTFPEERLTVKKSYTKLSKENEERAARERKEVEAVLSTVSLKRAWTCPFLRPVPGEVGSVFGLRRFFNNEPRSPHNGVDFHAEQGEPIQAVAAGIVLLAAEHFFAGNSVYVDHGQGVISMYFHLSEISVRQGQPVKAGDQLGLVGATGRVTGPHLHMGMRVLGQAVDPLPLMEGGCRVE